MCGGGVGLFCNSKFLGTFFPNPLEAALARAATALYHAELWRLGFWATVIGGSIGASAMNEAMAAAKGVPSREGRMERFFRELAEKASDFERKQILKTLQNRKAFTDRYGMNGQYHPVYGAVGDVVQWIFGGWTPD